MTIVNMKKIHENFVMSDMAKGKVLNEKKLTLCNILFNNIADCLDLIKVHQIKNSVIQWGVFTPGF